MLRFMLAVTLMAVPFPSLIASAQTYPSYRWDVTVDGSNMDDFTGLGVDAEGNTYLAGSTFAQNFTVKNAVQAQSASAGLFRIDGPAPAFATLGLNSAQAVAIDPMNPNVIYAGANGKGVLKSADGGMTFAVEPTGSVQVEGIAVDPTDDQNVYAATYDLGILKSSDGGATWAAMNNGLPSNQGQVQMEGIWIDPWMPNVLLAYGLGAGFSGSVRSADGGATWQASTLQPGSHAAISVYFDTANPGTLYATVTGQAYVSTDHGQTFTALGAPPSGYGSLYSVISDPNHAGRLIGENGGGIFESDDGGQTWALKLTVGAAQSYLPLAPDWADGCIYMASFPSAVTRISSDLQTTAVVGPPELGLVTGLAVGNGHVYASALRTRDVFVTKLDPNGNVVYSTYFGGSADDVATAMTVDASGGVYVTGTTGSMDFPVTAGAYASTAGTNGTNLGSSFLFKLNADGTVGYSTYYAAGASPTALAVDGSGSAYVAGSAGNGLPVTAGAYQGSPTLAGSVRDVNVGPTPIPYFGFAAKLDPAGSSLIYSTYAGGTVDSVGEATVIAAMALAADGSAYLGGPNGVFHLNATGTGLLGSLDATITPSAMTVGPDGSVYAGGMVSAIVGTFKATAIAFETSPQAPPPGQTGEPEVNGIVKMDAQLTGIESATYFGPSDPYTEIAVMTTDASGNLYVGGQTPPQTLPTRTPLQGGFAVLTGFVSELSGDLSTLEFSSYFGDTQVFTVSGLAVDASGDVLLGGATGDDPQQGGSVYVNSLTIAPSQALRIDAVVNASSMVDGPITPGETIAIEGAGFGSGAQVTLGGVAVEPASVSSTQITAVVPQSAQGFATGAAQVQVQVGGASSNAVLVPVGVN